MVSNYHYPDERTNGAGPAADLVGVPRVLLCACLSSLLWRFSCMIDFDTFIKLDYQSIEYALQTSVHRKKDTN